MFQDGDTEVINGVTYVRQNGQWHPQGGAVYGQPKTPSPQTPAQAEHDALGVEKLKQDLASTPIDIKGKQLDQQIKADEARRKQLEWDATHNPDGSKKPEVGGGSPMPQATQSDFQTKVSAAANLQRALNNFQDDYAGFGAGIENSIQGVTGLGTPGQRDWWADFKATDNLARNALFGGALTPGEQAAYAATSITPNMAPEEIRRNLQRRAQLAQDILARQREFLIANGYRKEAIDALMGPQQAPTPDAQPIDQPAMAPATTEETIVDPNLTPVRRKYVELLKAGASGTELVTFLRESGVTDPSILKTAGEQAAFRRKNPNAPISAYDTSAIDHYTRKMSGSQQMLNNAGQSGAGAFAAAAGNAVTGNNLDSIIGWTGGNEEQARLALEYSGRDHPGSALAGELVGGTTAALGGEAALGAAGMGAGFGRALIADSGYGAFSGAGAADNGNRLGGAVLGGVVGGVASGAAQGAMRGASRLAAGADNPEARYLVQQGVDGLSIGQAAGGSLKSAEDKAMSVPLLGDAIRSQRREGYRQFNTRAFDRALEPIGGGVNGLIGEEAVQASREQVSRAFDEALRGRSFMIDEEFGRAGRGPLERLLSIRRDNLGEEIVNRIEEVTWGHFNGDGTLSGENFQAMLASLRDIRQSYRNDPMYSRINDAVRGFENALESMVTRSDPSVVPAFNRARDAYRRVSILADAVNAAKNNREGNQAMFTTGQLGMADRANAKRYDGKMSAASGGSPFHEYHSNAQSVLPTQIPDSGTAGRVALMALPGVVGGGADAALGDGAGTGTKVGLGLTGVLVLAYSRAGQRRLVERILRQNPALARRLEERARLMGAGSTALAVGTTVDR